MTREIRRIATAAFVGALWVAPAWAQHAGHQTAGQPAPGSPEVALSACRQQSRLILNTIHQLAARLESAREVNSGSEMRSAMDDLQNALATLRLSATACVGDEESTAHAGHRMSATGGSGTPAPAARPVADHVAHHAPQTATSAQSVTITVTANGFEPARMSLRKGEPARLTFVRASDRTCGTEVVIPEHAIRRTLPLNEPVVIDLTPTQSGELTFTCGMNMLKGVIVVQ